MIKSHIEGMWGQALLLTSYQLTQCDAMAPSAHKCNCSSKHECAGCIRYLPLEALNDGGEATGPISRQDLDTVHDCRLCHAMDSPGCGTCGMSPMPIVIGGRTANQRGACMIVATLSEPLQSSLRCTMPVQSSVPWFALGNALPIALLSGWHFH